MKTRIAVRLLILQSLVLALLAFSSTRLSGDETRGGPLRVGFAAIDITPSIQDDQPIWLAGYGWGRKATGIHDPLFVRTVVLTDGQVRVAIVAVDLIGLQYPEVELIRSRLPDFDYIVVASTHNHEGPDTIGIWGKTPFQRGVDAAYLEGVVEKVAASVRLASQHIDTAIAYFGTAENGDLIGDSRLPIVKDGVLRTLRFVSATQGERNLGLLVQWNSHPESMGSQNTEVTADFCGVTVDWLAKKYQCPVVYVSGAIGGLMAPPQNFIDPETGGRFQEGDFAFTNAYGKQIGHLAEHAIEASSQISLTPIKYHAKQISIPLDNPLYRTARLAGVVRRQGVQWTGDFHELREPDAGLTSQDFAVKTEVAGLRLGEIAIAAVPGELYPELVYGQFQQPVDPAADYATAPLETPVAEIFSNSRWMLLGLANDEIGYLIPKRQWDWQPPFAYGRNRPQYGEINSCSADAAAIVTQALSECAQELK